MKPVNSRELFSKYCEPSEFARIIEKDTVIEMWRDVIKEFKDDIAIEDNGNKYSYAQLDQDMAEYRGVLASKGLKKGDRIGVFARNSYDLVKMFLAGVTFGLTVAILPAHLDEKTVFGCSMMFGLAALQTLNLSSISGI